MVDQPIRFHEFRHAGQTWSFYSFVKVEWNADPDGDYFHIVMRDHQDPDRPAVLQMTRQEFAAWLHRFSHFHQLPALLTGSYR